MLLYHSKVQKQFCPFLLSVQRIRGFTTMRCINLRFTYVLTCLPTCIAVIPFTSHHACRPHSPSTRHVTTPACRPHSPSTRHITTPAVLTACLHVTSPRLLHILLSDLFEVYESMVEIIFFTHSHVSLVSVSAACEGSQVLCEASRSSLVDDDSHLLYLPVIGWY